MNRRSGGFALILVIWSLVLLASTAAGFAYAVRHQIRVASDLTATAQAEAAATAALHTAILEFTTPSPDDRWVADGRIRTLPWPGATILLRVRPESSRVDLNKASRELLQGLLALLYPDQDSAALTDAIIDWRDPDSLTGPNGAEREQYSQAGYSYGPANTAFYSVTELNLVMGFDSRMVEKAKPYLTVFSRQPKVNAAGADLVTLAAVPGVGPDAAQDFVAQREQTLNSDGELDYTRLRNGRRYLDTRSSNSLLSIDIDVRLAAGSIRRERAVIQLDRRRGYRLLARETLPNYDTSRVPPDDSR